MSRVAWYPGHELILDAIVRAENCRLFDEGGRSWLDLESGVWCTPLGHGHPKVIRALTEQLARIGHTGFNYSSPVVDEAATVLLCLLGFENGRCVFLCSGSEAVEYGVRAARSVSERPLFLTMADSYFGAYGSASTRGSDSWHVFDWTACGECPDKTGCNEECPHWSSIPFERVGGFLLEPGSSSGLVRFPPEKLVRAIVRTVRESGGLVLVNEVTTGVGRTGRWFGFQHYGITPDVAALGKGIGNGYPVSATLFGPEITRRLGDEPIAYAQSHQNDPLGAAAARAVVGVIEEEELIGRSQELSKQLLGGLEAIRSRCRRVKAVRGRGLMAAMDLEDGPDRAFAKRTHRRLVERGFLTGLRPGLSILRFDPSLTIDLEDLACFLSVCEEVLREQ